MPDITMCLNDNCPLNHDCGRYNCIPKEYNQSYSIFKPKNDDELDEVECDYYIPQLPNQSPNK